jgi:hypothetical protein
MYTASQFTAGTRIRTQGASGIVTKTVGDGRDLVVHFTSDNSKQPRSVKPNINTTLFQAILTPKYTPRLGDRVRVSTKVPGFTGSLVGEVVYAGLSLDIGVKADADGVTYIFDENLFTYEKLELTWQQKLDALPVTTILQHKSTDNYVIKGPDKQWRSAYGNLTQPAEGHYTLPTASK